MDSASFKRQASKVKAALKTQPDGSVLTTRELKLYVPERFVEKKLAVVSAETYVVGIYALATSQGDYAVSTINAMHHVMPTVISTVKFDGESYLEMTFDPGSTVFATLDLIKEDILVYRIFDEIVAKGHIPWYLEYQDLATLFSSAKKHAGLDLTRVHAILEMIAAACARNPKQLTEYYRQGVTSLEEVVSHPPTIIPLRSITYGTTNTTSRLMGSYWDQGLNSALINPTTKLENVEDLLRR